MSPDAGALKWALVLASLVSGCATFRSYDQELTHTTGLAATGQVDAAIKALNKDNKGKTKDLLYHLELGELERLRLGYAASSQAWLAADAKVQEWEAAAKLDPSRVAGTAASYLVSDRLRPYEPHDYEKTLLTTRLAMDYLALGDWERARVAIKQTHEREAVIAELRAKEYAHVEEEAKKKGARVSFKELNGYPVQSIDNAEVNALRNGYQSAFSHYLAGFVYEALGEPSLAAAGYRQAIELNPGAAALEAALEGLDSRVSRSDNATDVLLVIESGLVPRLKSRNFMLPMPVKQQIVPVPVSFPVMEPADPGVVPSEVRVEGSEPLVTVQITSIDAMARRALKDDMPAIMLRGFVRSTTKAIAQYQALQAAQNKDSAMMGLAALAITAAAMVTEAADEREWRSLPARIAVARGKLAPGRHSVSIATPEGPRAFEIDVAGRYAFIGVRLVKGYVIPQPPKAPFAGGAEHTAQRRPDAEAPAASDDAPRAADAADGNAPPQGETSPQHSTEESVR